MLERSTLGYRLLRALIRIATQVFFGRVEVSGGSSVPREGAVIFCGNHPNSLLDPVLLLASTDRQIHFAAKDTLFATPVLRLFLRLAGAVPVRRRQDHGGGNVDNQEMFETMYAVLAHGRATGIFPEGISHERAQLAPLKTGAARMALGVKLKHPDSKVYFVPTGLVYFNRHRFRSNVLIQFGEPGEIDDAWLEQYRADPDAAVKSLTERIDARLRGLTVNADDWGQARVLDCVRRLYQPEGLSLAERARLARRFNLAYPRVKDQPDVRALYRRIEEFLARKRAAEVDDATLRDTSTPIHLALRLAQNALLLLLYLPLFIAGAAVHVPLGLALKLAGRKLAPRSDVVATTKFVLGFLSILLVYGVVIATTAWTGGLWSALSIAVLLPLSGWATVRVVARLRAMREALYMGLRLATYRSEIALLRSERVALANDVAELVHRYRQFADDAEAELAGAGA